MNGLRKLAVNLGIRELVVARRCMKIMPNDIIVAAYPKSGSTWLRMMLANVVSRNEANFDNLTRYAPGLNGLTPEHKPYFNRGQGRLVQTHEPWRKSFKRALCVVRDPRDVAVSYYHHKLRNNEFEGRLTDFVKEFCLGSVANYGKWGDHVASWQAVARRDSENFLFVRYEEMLRRPVETLWTISEFCGIVGVSGDGLENAVAMSSANEMRKMEGKRRRAADRVEKGREDSFIRSAGAETWRDRLSGKDIECIESTMGDVLVQCGYERSE